MLVAESGDVVAYRLITGLEVFGKFESEKDGKISLSDALFAHVAQNPEDPQGPPALQFLPLSILIKTRSHSDIELERTSIAYRFDIEPMYSNAYLQAVSPIIRATAF